MIGAGALGAGPITLPFLRKGSPVIPLPPNTWQGLGTDSASNGGGIADAGTNGIGIANGETLFVALVCDNGVNVDGMFGGGGTFCGVQLNGTGPDIFGANGLMAMYLGNNTGADMVGRVDLNFTTSTGQPTIIAWLMSRVSTLNVAIASSDKKKSATGTGTNQDSGLSVNILQAKEFLWGTIGTNGFGSDTLGTWQTSFTAGQRASNVNGLDLKEGYRFVNAIAGYRAQVTGATNRNWRSTLTTYRGI